MLVHYPVFLYILDDILINYCNYSSILFLYDTVVLSEDVTLMQDELTHAQNGKT